jgi:hypothetical protein
MNEWCQVAVQFQLNGRVTRKTSNTAILMYLNCFGIHFLSLSKLPCLAITISIVFCVSHFVSMSVACLRVSVAVIAFI